ncbi:MAG: HlyD family secretion protein [Planctomycetota bacterium]|jgi:multidrug efflux pump subunit AcrA (membrane-fusion protein)
MAVKFRRIENHGDSVAQLRQRTEEGRERRHILPKVVIGIVVLLIIGALVAYFRPPRIVAPFIVHADPVLVTSPGAGTVTWLLSKDTERVEKGDVVARILLQPQTSDSVGARLTELRLRTATARADLRGSKASRETLNVQLQQQERELKVRIETLEEQLRRSEMEARQAARRLDARGDDLQTGRKLRALRAATEQEYQAAREAHDDAGAAHEAALSRQRSLSAELVSARSSLKEFAETEGLLLAAAESRLQAASETYEALQQAAQPQVAAFSPDTAELILKAPVAARLLDLDVAENSSVEHGAPLVSLYEPARLVARVYVPVRHADGLREGAAARLYPEGRRGVVEGEVVYVHDRVVPLPPSLRRRLGYDEPNVVRVDIRLAGASPLPLVPGQTGKAVIKK